MTSRLVAQSKSLAGVGVQGKAYNDGEYKNIIHFIEREVTFDPLPYLGVFEKSLEQLSSMKVVALSRVSEMEEKINNELGYHKQSMDESVDIFDVSNQ